MMPLPVSPFMVPHETNGVVYYTFPIFDACPFVKHGFSTRLGGVSRGIYESMNLSFGRGDEKADVEENFRRFCSAVGVRTEDVVVSAQEHHTVIYHATAADRGRGTIREKGYTDVDGLVTDEPGVALMTQYADCVPLLFLDPVRHVVGTSHAGWKGTVARIGQATVEKMCRDYGCRPENILVGIAPSIGPCCFEVDAPVAAEFSAMQMDLDGCIVPHPHDKYYINLWEVNRRVLLDAGIQAEHIAVAGLCSKCNADVFWSHRATAGKRGNMAAVIALDASW